MSTQKKWWGGPHLNLVLQNVTGLVTAQVAHGNRVLACDAEEAAGIKAHAALMQTHAHADAHGWCICLWLGRDTGYSTRLPSVFERTCELCVEHALSLKPILPFHKTAPAPVKPSLARASSTRPM